MYIYTILHSTNYMLPDFILWKVEMVKKNARQKFQENVALEVVGIPFVHHVHFKQILQDSKSVRGTSSTCIYSTCTGTT